MPRRAEPQLGKSLISDGKFVTIVVSWHYGVTDWPTWCLGTLWGDYCWPDIRSLEVFPRLPRPRLGSRSWVRTHSRRYIKVQGVEFGRMEADKKVKKKERGFDLLQLQLQFYFSPLWVVLQLDTGKIKWDPKRGNLQRRRGLPRLHGVECWATAVHVRCLHWGRWTAGWKGFANV